jgi:hypothetical protein
MRNVRGDLTIPVLAQFIKLHHQLSMVVLHDGVQDPISWCWCSCGSFSTALAYHALFIGQVVVLGAKELWRSQAPNKCHFWA